MQECFEAGDPDDHCSHTLEEITNQNPPHDSDPNEDELLGPVTNISIPGRHLDNSITLIVSPRGRQLVTIKHESLAAQDNSHMG